MKSTHHFSLDALESRGERCAEEPSALLPASVPSELTIGEEGADELACLYWFDRKCQRMLTSILSETDTARGMLDEVLTPPTWRKHETGLLEATREVGKCYAKALANTELTPVAWMATVTCRSQIAADWCQNCNNICLSFRIVYGHEFSIMSRIKGGILVRDGST